MTDPDADKRRLELEAEAEAEAQAEAELAMHQRGSAPAPRGTPAPDDKPYSAGEFLTRAIESPYHAVIGASDLVNKYADNLGARLNENPDVGSLGIVDPRNWVGAAGDTLFQGTKDPNSGIKTAENVATRVRDLTTGIVPGLQPLAKYATDKLDQLVDGPSPANQTRGFPTRDVFNNIADAAPVFAPGIARASQGVAEGARDFIAGPPREAVLEQMAGKEEAYGNILNAGSRRTTGEDTLVTKVGDSADTFTKENPVAGIDPASGRQGIIDLETNLGNVRVNGIKTRNTILNNVSELEDARRSAAIASGQPGKIGIDFQDIPETVTNENGLQSGLTQIANTRPGGGSAVKLAREYVGEQFGINPKLQEMGIPDELLPPSRTLSAQEANTARMRIDNQIREVGGFDDAQLSQFAPNMNPSIRDAYVDALKYYRGQLDGLLKNHIADLAGGDAANAFHEAGQHISMASDYLPLVGRFKRETGQAFTPGSAKAVPPGGGGVLGRGGIVDAARGGMFPEGQANVVAMRAASREENALRDLQRLVDLKSQANFSPIPRSLARIKTSFDYLGNVENVAISLGLLNAPGTLSKLPDPVARRVVSSVAQAVPQMFEQVPDKVNVIDGEYQSPQDKDAVIQQALNKSPAERARIIGESFKNQYQSLNNDEPPTPQTALPALPASLDELSQNIRSVTSKASPQGLDKTGDKEQMNILDRLNAAIAIHQ